MSEEITGQIVDGPVVVSNNAAVTLTKALTRLLESGRTDPVGFFKRCYQHELEQLGKDATARIIAEAQQQKG